MQEDMRALWQQEILRRMQEAQLAEAAKRPTPPPAPPGRIKLLWRAVVNRLRGRRRPVPAAAAQPQPTVVPAEVDDTPCGVWEETVRSCEQALAARPDLVGLWVGLSLAAGRLGDLDMAEGAYAVASVLSPAEAEGWRDALERDFPEIYLPEAVEDGVALPGRLANSGNGR
jgi:hypothetical protein